LRHKLARFATQSQTQLGAPLQTLSTGISGQPNWAAVTAKDAADIPSTETHGPALCVRRLGTLRGHRSFCSDLRLPDDKHRYAAWVSLLFKKL
jgi:hypothetical protein